MDNSVLVSAIVIANNSLSIEKTLVSLLNQSYRNLEVILVTNHKLEKSVFNLTKTDKRLKVISLRYDFNLLNFILQGLNQATGEFIIIQTSYGTNHNLRIEKQLNYFKVNPEKSIVACLIKSLNSNPFSKDIEESHNMFTTEAEVNDAIIGGYLPLFLDSIMIKKGALLKLNSIVDKTSINEVDILLTLIKYNSIEKLKETLFFFNDFLSTATSIKEYYNSITNKLNLFNSNKSIEYRNYLNQISILNSEKVQYTGHKNILIVIDKLYLGGTETYIFSMCKILSQLGFNLFIASSGGVLTEIFTKQGFKVIYLNLEFDESKNDFLDDNYDKLREILNNYDIKLMHCHLEKEMIFCKNAYEKFHIPYVITLHGVFYSKDIISYACSKASAVISVSNPVRLLCDELGVKSNLIYNGVNVQTKVGNTFSISEKLNLPKNSKIITYCSRLEWSKTKAAEFLLKSIEVLSSKYTDIYVVIIGEGSKKSIIKNYAELINKKIKRKVVNVIGAIYNVADYFNESTLVVGTGRVALEAMACSKPVLALGSKGYAGIVKEANSNLILDQYFGDHHLISTDSTLNLTQDIEYLLNHDAERLAIGHWSRQWCVSNFNEVDMGKKIGEIYDSLIS